MTQPNLFVVVLGFTGLLQATPLFTASSRFDYPVEFNRPPELCSQTSTSSADCNITLDPTGVYALSSAGFGLGSGVIVHIGGSIATYIPSSSHLSSQSSASANLNVPISILGLTGPMIYFELIRSGPAPLITTDATWTGSFGTYAGDVYKLYSAAVNNETANFTLLGSYSQSCSECAMGQNDSLQLINVYSDPQAQNLIALFNYAPNAFGQFIIVPEPTAIALMGVGLTLLRITWSRSNRPESGL